MTKSQKETIYQELLTMFCGDDELRPKLLKPFFDGEDVCSSDTHSLIRIKKDKCGLADVPVGYKRLPVKYLDVPLRLEVEWIVKALLACKMEDETVEISPAVPCLECDGDGTVEWEYSGCDCTHYTKYDDCPVCKGSGNLKDAVVRKTGRKMPIVYADSISINDVTFDAYRLFYLVEACNLLGVETIKVTALNFQEPMAIQLNDDVEFILMPMIHERVVANITLDEWK